MLRARWKVPKARIPLGMVLVGLALVLIAPSAWAETAAGPGDPEAAEPPLEAAAEPPHRDGEPDRQEPDELTQPVVYVPPLRGSPRARVGGALRGAPALPTPLVLAPQHVAETVSERPSLFWHIDTLPGSEAQLLFTLIDAQEIDPVAEISLPAPTRPGIQRIDLDRYGIALDPGIEYEWSITLVADGRQRARDRISTGSIRRVAPPAALGFDLAAAPAYAANGLWYDALASISDAIEASPSDSTLRHQRDALLRQADLGAAVH